jgi:hypothetical protein
MKTFTLLGKTIETDYPMDADEIAYVLFDRDLNELSELRYDMCESLAADMKRAFN